MNEVVAQLVAIRSLLSSLCGIGSSILVFVIVAYIMFIFHDIKR